MGHPALDFIDFFSEMVGDPGIEPINQGNTGKNNLLSVIYGRRSWPYKSTCIENSAFCIEWLAKYQPRCGHC